MLLSTAPMLLDGLVSEDTVVAIVLLTFPPLGLFATAAITTLVTARLRYEPARLGPAIVVGLTRLFPLLLLVLFVLLCLTGVWFAVSIIFMLTRFLGVPLVFAFLALLVRLTCNFWVALPVAVLERPGMIASLRRSAALTRNRRWRVLGIFVPQIILFTGVAIVFEAILDPGGSPLAIDVTMLCYVTALAMVQAWSAVSMVVSYHALLRDHKGTPEHELAQIFD